MKSVRSAILLLSCLGCATSDSRLHEGEPRKLIDGTISLKTEWAPGSETQTDIRRIKSRDGAVTCEFLAHDRGHFVGNVPEEEWVRIWNSLFETDPFGRARFDVEPDDPAGGPYHLVRLELGRHGHEFSAQVRKSLLVFSSKDTNERVELAGEIVQLVSRFATTKVALAAQPADDPKGTKGAPKKE